MAVPREFTPEFIKQVRSGDLKARNRLMKRLHPVLKGYFVKRIGMKPEVDDLIQNTLVRVHRGLPDLQQPAGFLGFVMKAALFELQDMYRGRYSARESLFDPEDPPDMPVASRAGSRLDLDQAMAKLSPRAREIIELRQNGYRYKEIAEMIDTTEAAVKMQVKRAFERLRDYLIVIFTLSLPTSIVTFPSSKAASIIEDAYHLVSSFQ